MDFDAIEAAKREARWGNLAPATKVRMRETHPEVRPWNLTVDDIRHNGALFNVFKGTPAGARAEIHTHPVADECLFNWLGSGEYYCDGDWVESETLDCLLALCGMHQSVGGPRDLSAGPSYGCGYASPPQLDLYLRTPFYHEGTFDEPPWATLPVK